MLFDINKLERFKQDVAKSSCMSIVCMAHLYNPQPVDGQPENRLLVYQALPDLVEHMGLLHRYLEMSGVKKEFIQGVKKLDGI